jgi:hypothetical protein
VRVGGLLGGGGVPLWRLPAEGKGAVQEVPEDLHLPWPLPRLRSPFARSLRLAKSKYSLKSWDELVGATFPKEPFHLDPYIVKGGITFLFGPKSTGKSPLQWSWAKAIGSGRPWLGLPTSKGRCLILEMDQPESTVHMRLKEMGEKGVEGVFFLSGPPMNVPNLGPQTLDELRTARDSVLPDVVFFNTLRTTTTLPLEDGTTARLVYGWAREMFPGCSLVFVHHPKKEPPSNVHVNEDEMFSGSNAWRNDAQVSLHLQKFHLRERKRLVSSARLRHTGSQVSPLYRPLPLLLKGGHTWTSPLVEDLEGVDALYRETGFTGGSLDRLMVERDIVGSPSTARRKRLMWEKGFPGREWLGLESQVEEEEEDEEGGEVR